MTKLEDVARAICIADDRDPDHFTGPRIRLGDVIQLEVSIREWQNYRSHAHAAIQALMEPSEGMVKAAAATVKMKAVDAALQIAQVHGSQLTWGDWDDSPIYDAWQAMLTAALEEE